MYVYAMSIHTKGASTTVVVSSTTAYGYKYASMKECDAVCSDEYTSSITKDGELQMACTLTILLLVSTPVFQWVDFVEH